MSLIVITNIFLMMQITNHILFKHKTDFTICNTILTNILSLHGKPAQNIT